MVNFLLVFPLGSYYQNFTKLVIYVHYFILQICSLFSLDMSTISICKYILTICTCNKLDYFVFVWSKWSIKKTSLWSVLHTTIPISKNSVMMVCTQFFIWITYLPKKASLWGVLNRTMPGFKNVTNFKELIV